MEIGDQLSLVSRLDIFAEDLGSYPQMQVTTTYIIPDDLILSTGFKGHLYRYFVHTYTQVNTRAYKMHDKYFKDGKN